MTADIVYEGGGAIGLAAFVAVMIAGLGYLIYSHMRPGAGAGLTRDQEKEGLGAALERNMADLAAILPPAPDPAPEPPSVDPALDTIIPEAARGRIISGFLDNPLQSHMAECPVCGKNTARLCPEGRAIRGRGLATAALRNGNR